MLLFLAYNASHHILIQFFRVCVVALFVVGGRIKSKRKDNQMATVHYLMAAVWVGVFVEPYF